MNLKNHKRVLMAGATGLAILLAGCGNQAPAPGGQNPGGGGQQPGGGQDNGRRPTGRPNLRIGFFDANVQPDGSVKVEVEVANTGQGDARRNSVLRIVRLPEKGRAITLADEGVGRIPGGSSSNRQVITIPAGRLPVGNAIVLRARADATNVIDETRPRDRRGELDNFADKTIPYGPDLVVKGIARDEASETNPRNLVVLARVGNAGNVTTGGFTGQWQYKVKDTPAGAQDRGDSERDWINLDPVQISAIAPGKEGNEIRFQFPQQTADRLAGKNVVVRLALDPDGRIRELSNDNNRLGVSHEFPPQKPDINVFGLMARYNPNSSDVIRFNPMIANTGETATGTFDSQWFRLDAGVDGGASGTAGTPNAPWRPLGQKLTHESIAPKTIQPLSKSPTMRFTPDVQEEGRLVALKFEADVGNKVDEFTDTGRPVAEGQAGPNLLNFGNGPNNSFVWNFQIPRLARSDLALRYIVGWLSPDRSRLDLQVGVSNFGSIGSGPFKVSASLDSQRDEQQARSLPPSSDIAVYGLELRLTQAMRQSGRASLAVRITPTKSERESRNDAVAGLLFFPPVPRLPADIAVGRVELVLKKSRTDKANPNKVDRALVRYTLFNRGEEATGPFKGTVSIEGGPSSPIDDEDGIAPRGHIHRESEEFDITGMARPDRFVPVQAKVEVSCPEDKNESNNSRESNIEQLTPRPPDRPAPLPDLRLVSIGLRQTSTPQNVHLKCAVTNEGEADAPAYKIYWFVNGQVPGDKEDKPENEHRITAPALRRGETNDQYDAHWLDWQPKASETDLVVSVLVDPGNVVREDDESLASNAGFTKVDKNAKGTGRQAQPKKLDAPAD